MTAATATLPEGAVYPASTQQVRLWRAADGGRPGSWTSGLVELPADLDPERLATALAAVSGQVEALRTRLSVTEDGTVLQVIGTRPTTLDQDPGAGPDRTAAASAPTGPEQFRATLFADKSLLLQAPAWLADRRSLALVGAAIATAYAEGAAAEPALQYRQYALWQRDQEPATAGDAADPAHRGLPLLTPDRPPGLVECHLDDAVRSTVTRLADRLGRSVGDTLGVCWAAVALRHRDGAATGLDLVDANRPLADLGTAIGAFETWTGPVALSDGPAADLAAALADASPAADPVPDVGWAGADPEVESRFPLRWVTSNASAQVVAAGYRPDAAGHVAVLWLSGPDPDALRVLADQVGWAAAELLADPAQPASTLVLTAGEDDGPTEPAAAPADVLSRVRAAAREQPAAVAVRYRTEETDYQSLTARSAAIAARLARTARPPESVVAVRVDPGPDLVAAILGVWGAGLTVCPFDPEWPAERTRTILTAAGATVLVADRAPEPADLVPEGVELLRLDEPTPAGPAVDHVAPDPASLAYVLFTSGSTGRPKGVAVSHGAIAHYLDWASTAYPVTAGRGTLVHTSVGFDLTLTGLLAPLLLGGAVNIAPSLDFEGLIRTLGAEQDFGMIKLTPSHLRLLSELRPGDAAAGITQALVIGGEALTEDLLRYWWRHAAGTRLVNEYGPTEATVGLVTWTATGPAGRVAVPIGTPASGAVVRLLDRRGRAVGTGVVGELHLGGPQLARGYVGDPRLTAARFVPAAGAAAPGQRLYRTGDLARRLPDGSMEYLGRTDDQIQLNGVRTEPAEVEGALAGIDGVRAAAVRARRDGRRLVLDAFVTADAALDPTDLRRMAQQRLPAAWVPETFTLLEALPLTANGKLDRGALPTAETRTSAPAVVDGDTSQRVHAIWCEVLGVSAVGDHDNFFDIGGNSFLLLDLAAKLQVQVSPTITPFTIFERPTIAELVSTVTGAAPAAATPAGDDDEARRARTEARREAIERRRAQRRTRDGGQP